jgi:hypothetical protein
MRKKELALLLIDKFFLLLLLHNHFEKVDGREEEKNEKIFI